jgi:hypothetical protein
VQRRGALRLLLLVLPTAALHRAGQRRASRQTRLEQRGALLARRGVPAAARRAELGRAPRARDQRAGAEARVRGRRDPAELEGRELVGAPDAPTVGLGLG